MNNKQIDAELRDISAIYGMMPSKRKALLSAADIVEKYAAWDQENRDYADMVQDRDRADNERFTIEQDRDKWRSIAERLAAALKTIEDEFGYVMPTSTLGSVEDALAAF